MRFGLLVGLVSAVLVAQCEGTAPAPAAGCTLSSRQTTSFTNNGKVCVKQLSADGKAAVHYKREGDVVSMEMVVELAGSAGGWAAIGFPQTPGNMVGSKVAVSDGQYYELKGKSSAQITAIDGSGTPFNVNGNLNLQASTSNGLVVMAFKTKAQGTRLDMVAAWSSTGTFPATKHQTRLGFAIEWAATSGAGASTPRPSSPTTPSITPAPTTPAPAASCTRSTRKTTSFANNGKVCVKKLSADGKAAVHYKREGAVVSMEVVVELAANSNGGWAAIGFPKTPGNMVGSKVAVSDGQYYELKGKSSAQITVIDGSGTPFNVNGNLNLQASTSNRLVVLAFKTKAQGKRLNMVAAWSSTGTFPATKHQTRLGFAIEWGATSGAGAVAVSHILACAVCLLAIL